MTGNLPQASLPPLMAACAGYVFPSYTEGCPRSLIEAMACRMPVVATDLPGVRALDPEAPDRAVIWVPGSADVIALYVPLFVFLRELGYAQSFEFGPLAEGLEDWAELMVPLTDMGAQFSNDNEAAFLAPSSEAPETATAEVLEQEEAKAAVSEEEADADTRRLIVILLGSLIRQLLAAKKSLQQPAGDPR